MPGDDSQFEEKEREIDNLYNQIDNLQSTIDSQKEQIDRYQNNPTQSNDISYYKEALEIIKLNKTTPNDPRMTNKNFIELLIKLDQNGIIYKNRLIFLKEFMKNIDEPTIVDGIIKALKDRQEILKTNLANHEEMKMMDEIEKKVNDIDMGLSVCIYKKNLKMKESGVLSNLTDKTITDIYNSGIKSFFYKYNLYLIQHVIKEKLNDDVTYQGSTGYETCDKYFLYHHLLTKISESEKGEKFFDEIINQSDLT